MNHKNTEGWRTFGLEVTMSTATLDNGLMLLRSASMSLESDPLYQEMLAEKEKLQKAKQRHSCLSVDLFDNSHGSSFSNSLVLPAYLACFQVALEALQDKMAADQAKRELFPEQAIV